MKKIAVLVLALILALSATALAEFPEKQITVVCPYAAGGASDTTSRIYAQMLSEAAGVPVIVDNRTGSKDSRFWNDPFVTVGSVGARVLICVPLTRWHGIPLPQLGQIHLVG